MAALQSDFDAELDRVRRARAEIDLLRKKQANQQQPQGEMVGNQYVAPHWTQSLLAPLAQNVGIGIREGMTNQREGVLNKAMESQANQWQAARPQATPPTELQGPHEEATPFGEAPPAMMSRGVQPSQQDQLAWSQQGQSNPLTRALAARFGEDALINEPVRQEARDQANLTREDKQKEGRATLAVQQQLAREKAADQLKLDREKLAEKAESAKRHDETLRYGFDSRSQLAKSLAALKGQQESPTAAKERQKIEGSLNQAFDRHDALKEAETILPQSTGSGAGTAIDKLANFAGYPLQGAQAAAKLRSLEGRLIAGGPKYGGSTSNQDVKDYKAAVGSLADTTQPVKVRQEALATVQRIARQDLERVHKHASAYNASRGENVIDVPDLPDFGVAPVAPERRQGDRRTSVGNIGGVPSDPTTVEKPLQPVPMGKPAAEGTRKQANGVWYVKRNGQWMAE
jgi:hypothetical protein